MDERVIETLMSTVTLISNNLDIAPHSWRDQLQAIRSTTTSLELTETVPNEARRRWQLSLISVFQRVAFADADNGVIQDVADWCLRQALVMLQVYPEDPVILALIGRNWLLRAQKSLANVYRAERSSSSSEEYGRPGQRSTDRAFVEAEGRLYTADYVEARGLLLPATEFLQRAVNAARAQGNVTGALLATAAEAYMSLGNVTSSRANNRYFQQAMAYLRATMEDPNYSLPTHLEQYLDEYGPLYPYA
ncbi:Nn.00g053920.m01.CDS01 [Neocucurbitaria sp. VM-36]